jgi:hypothetical protein
MTRSSLMIESSRRSSILDLFRVPYVVSPGIGEDDWELQRAGDGATELRWAKPTTPPAFHVLEGLPFIGSVRADREVECELDSRSWTRGATILDASGARAGSIWHGADGSVRFPFDPDELITSVLTERYLEGASPATARFRGAALSAYYATRPLLPRRTQIALRRRFMKIQERQRFPQWPIETRVHDFYTMYLASLETVAGRLLPSIAPWPDGAQWSFVITHDVEHRAGYELLDEVLDIERALEVRSAWYFTPERDYVVSDIRVDAMATEGFEVGLQGLHHDGHDLDRRRFSQRLPAMQRYVRRWNASGFRAPSTRRDWEMIAQIGLDYDTSYSDVARYEPQPGGTGTWLPFFNGDLVELPITLPMDHTVFELLREKDERLWVEKAELLRARGGMALLLTHPDYQLEPSRLESYARFLERMVRDPTVWVALPRDVSAWWRARNTMRLVEGPSGWEIEGDADGRARIVDAVGKLVEPGVPPLE